jgi:RNA polymerase subunit RPABC4/transcription elongation factor Spt4
MNATEVECPICDRKIQSDIKECPNCGAELSLSNFEDLEEVAIKLSKSDIQKPLEAKVDSKEPSHGVELKVEEMKSEPLETEKKKELRLLEKPQKEEKVTIDPNKDESRHGFGRLFGKKKK